jgi:glyoxylase-like metal-dependent hydrolase (beta-lactamase superfamily II)/rhodanese-related sulfurtransferase
VLFRQFVDDDLGCCSYLVGDEQAGVAAIVDPAYRIEPYLDEARRHGVVISRVLETHTHADHVSGHGRLALEHGATVAIHPAAAPEYPFEPLVDGGEIELGDVAVRVVHTPGHRPEHCAFAVVDRARASEPWLVLSGDSLFVGDAARPDLAVEPGEGAEGLFHSLQRLTALADGVELFPGHVAGSLCGAAMSSKPSSTIGYERRFNRALLVPELGEFVAELAGSLPPRPPNMDRIVALNRGPFLGAPQPLEPIGHAPADAIVLDVRPARDFAGGHVAAALNVPLDGGSFATKAGFVLDVDVPVALHASSAADAERAAHGLRSVGFLQLAGRLDEPATPARLAVVELDQLDALLNAGEVEVLDVREPDEYELVSIPGTRNVPYRLVREDRPGDRPVVTICETGARAAIAASVLAAEGVDARPVLSGGVSAWQARRREAVPLRRPGS